jgi:predicted DNA-binding transcriptional regulator AlpA
VNLISLEQVVDLTGLSRSSLAKKRRDGPGVFQNRPHH